MKSDQYIQSIKSVLIIDDQFPVYGDPGDVPAKETPRARALWAAFSSRGWLCDVERQGDIGNNSVIQRVANCDLLILDYHLGPNNDPVPALRIISKLASLPSPNIVVVYTLEKNLDEVLFRSAFFARGRRGYVDVGLQPREDWTNKQIASYLRGDEFEEADEIETWIVDKYGQEYGDDGYRPLQSVSLQPRYFQTASLFVLIVQKQDDESDREAARLIDDLSRAMRDWNPSLLACMFAASRRSIEADAFGADRSTVSPELEGGIWEYLASGEESYQRAHYVAERLLSYRLHSATRSLAQMMIKNHARAKSNISDVDKYNQRLHLNAFLCSQPFDLRHITIGTIVEIDNEFYLCVSPACDMELRPPNSENPWGVSLDPWRPVMFAKLESENPKKAVNKSEQGGHVFVNNSSNGVAAYTYLSSSGQPRIYVAFLKDRGELTEDNAIHGIFLRKDECGAMLTQDFRGKCISQLRAPYAENISQKVGGHISRIGVDFFKGPR